MSVNLGMELIASSSYRDFLKGVLVAFQREEPRFSYTCYSKVLGFQSRNAVRDIIEGRRRMSSRTLQSLTAFLTSSSRQHRALAPLASGVRSVSRSSHLLSAREIRYLELLVYLEEPDLDPKSRSLNELELEKAKMRHRLSERMSQESSLQSMASLYQFSDWPRVYAALGDSRGATLEEVMARTGLEMSVIQETLAELVAQELVSRSGSRFLATDRAVHLSKLGGNDFFRAYFQSGLKESLKATKSDFESSDHLFHDLQFSVQRKDIPRLCKALSEVLQDFAVEAEDPAGDTVLRLMTTLRP